MISHEIKRILLEVILINSLPGTQQIDVEITRTQTAQSLIPAVTTRQLHTYLHLASLYLPQFSHFRDLDEGGVNRFARLTTWHLPALQKIRSYVRYHGIKKLKIEMANNPQAFTNTELNKEQVA